MKIVLLLVVAFAAFLGYVATRSPDYKIERQITIQAPAEKIFPYLNSSKLANDWMPWKEEDPSVKMEFSGPDAGVGSKSTWTAGKKLGVGSAVITESEANKRVAIKLEYREPMQMTQDAEYLITASGADSVVTWRVTGKNSFAGRLMCVFMNMDKMVGGMFEKGLLTLKNLVEKK